MFGGIDIRNVGSGNPGATNVFRTVGKGAGIATFIADTLKGFIPVYFAAFVNDSFSYSIVVAAVAITGHMASIFLKFKGGKGVATGLGAFLALMLLPALVAIVIFSVVFVLSGYVALGAICAAASLPLASYFSRYDVEYIVFAFAVAVAVIYKHRTNIRRLRQGTENRFNLFKRKW
jgi:glycerol-3-phosphate acyltransferase PlsY